MEFTAYAGYEIRKWIRDSMSLFMLGFFLLFGAAGRYLVPGIENRWALNLSPYYHVVLAGLALTSGRIIGAVAGFSILDDRDDNVTLAVKVAPMSLEAFIGLKLAMVYVLSLLGCIFVLQFSALLPLAWPTVLGVSVLAAFGAPLSALQINCLASNKIEGFAMIKSLNLLVAIPIVALFVRGAREFFFAVEPGFWAAKALAVAVLGPAGGQLSYGGYVGIGFVYTIAVGLALYQVFKRRV